MRSRGRVSDRGGSPRALSRHFRFNKLGSVRIAFVMPASSRRTHQQAPESFRHGLV